MKFDCNNCEEKHWSQGLQAFFRRFLSVFRFSLTEWSAVFFFSFQKISKNRSLLHFQNFFLERTSRMIQFWYWGWNRQHPCFQTHQQLYQYYTHNRLDLLPKWLHESKIPKSEKVNFSIFMVSPIESSVQRESSSHPYYQIFSGRIP